MDEQLSAACYPAPAQLSQVRTINDHDGQNFEAGERRGNGNGGNEQCGRGWVKRS